MKEMKFGTFEQGNGPAPIEWLVLAEEDGRKLLLSKYALKAGGAHKTLTKITWDNCDLRQWLNNDFLNAAFTAEEQNRIQMTSLPAEKNPDFDHPTGEATEDKIFILSMGEVEKYLPNQEDRICHATKAAEEGMFIKADGCYWWTRNPGYSPESFARVQNDGSIFTYGSYVFVTSQAIRPAMWIAD